MSKYKRVETDIKSEALLVKALQDLKIAFEQGEALPLFGYQGDRRRETAEVVIRRHDIGLSANDLGFHRREDGGFEAVISEYDSRTHGQKMLNQVRQRYAYHAVCQQARARGYNVVEQKAEGGAVRLQLVRR